MNLRETLPDSLLTRMERPVAVFGVGSSGRAVMEILRRMKVSFRAYDERAGEEDTGRTFTEREAGRHDLVLHSPAFAPDHAWIRAAAAAGCECLSEIDFAQQLRRGPTLVITGTNGKTTLQEFATFALKRAGISAVAAGQNQYPLSRLAVRPELDGVTAICEMGPALARVVKHFRFETLFWTNFREDHVEDPGERRDLFESILRLSSLSPEADFYVGESVVEAAGECGVPLPEKVRTARPEDMPRWELPDSSAFSTVIHRPALALFRRYWLERGFADEQLKAAAEAFAVRAHRLHPCAEAGRVRFWNDSKAGNFAATEAALRNFSDPVLWIGGGRYRGGDLRLFAERIAQRIRMGVLLGDVAPRLQEVLEEKGIPCRIVHDLRAGVEEAFSRAEPGEEVVFSPGFVAGEQYGDFMERGICFENAVLGLKHWRGGA